MMEDEVHDFSKLDGCLREYSIVEEAEKCIRELVCFWDYQL